MPNFYKFILCLFIPLCSLAQVAPTATILPTSTYSCTGIPITYSAIPSRSTATFTWAVAPVSGLVAFSNLYTNTLSLTFSLNITYTVTLFVSDSAGVSSSFTRIVPARSPKAAFNASLNSTGYPNQLILTNYSSNSTNQSWVYNDVATADTTFDAVKNYANSGSYNVTLIARGAKGCADTARYNFRISDSSGVTLPNVFSPNGDQVNDVYRPIARGIVKLSANVFNRDAVLIASWDRVNGFWDGHTTSGEACDAGTYFIVVQATGFDGKTYKVKSSITLVR
jgi:gliding motility-associated-like protein